MGDLLSPVALHGGAIFSECRTWRYLFWREVQSVGLVFSFFGVNGSTAAEDEEDQTTMKWRGFTIRNGGRRYYAANPFAFVATDVRELAKATDPVGPDNDTYITEAIEKADILVPCWGNSSKVPERLRPRLRSLRDRLFASGKPVKIFGLTKSGDPKHPLMLGYDTPLTDWPRP